VARKRKHQHRRDTVGGTVVLVCKCGWRAWPTTTSWVEPAGPIPPEREQWERFNEHKNKG